jgi:hypothetical protein
LLHRLNAPEYYQLGIFIGMFLLYCLLASQAWIVANKISNYQYYNAAGNNTNAGVVNEPALDASLKEAPPKKALTGKVTPLK